MSSGEAKTYLSKRNVPALFECLMTGLMFHRPNDHIQYLIECLQKVKAKGQEDLQWNMFVETQRAKTTALPPIAPTNGRRPISRERSITPKECWFISEEVASDVQTPQALPPIGHIPNVPIVFLTGGPGSGACHQATRLQKTLPGWHLISLGELLRQEVRGQAGGTAKWKMVSDLMDDGELAPEDVVQTILLTHLKSSPNAKGFIINGFPRDMEQARQFNSLVGRVDAVFFVDCEQETLSQALLSRTRSTGRLENNVNTVAKRIQTFKDRTLPVLKHYDELGKLHVIEGEKTEEEIAEDLAIIFHTVMSGITTLPPVPHTQLRIDGVESTASGKFTAQKARSPKPKKAKFLDSVSPPTSPLPEPEDLPAHLMPPELKVKDTGRKAGMAKAPIIFLAGGPGSGKGTQCKRLLSRYTQGAHLSMGDILRSNISTKGTADAKWAMVTDLLRQGDLAPEDVTVELLTTAIKSQPNAHFYLVEGFPRNMEQLEDFNKEIGGQSFTVLLDCEEQILHYRLSMRGKTSQRIDDNLTAIGKKLTFFKNHTLPMLKTIDDSGKLVVVDGDRDEYEIFFDLCKVFDFAIYGNYRAQPKITTDDKEPVEEEVIEAAIVPALATTTGDNIANPKYTAELNAADVASNDSLAN